MAPRKNTKSASTPAPVAASNIAKAPTGRKNTTKSASTPAPVAASKDIKVPAGRKNTTKSATTPAPVAASKTANVSAGRKNTKSTSTSEAAKTYSGRKTRAMIAAEEKAAAEAAAKPAQMAPPVKGASNAKPAVTRAKNSELATTAQPVKGKTLKSASNALKALRGAAKTNQDNTNETTGELPTSTTKPATMKPATVQPAATNDIITKRATIDETKATATKATIKMPPINMVDMIKIFRAIDASKKPVVQQPVTEKPVIKEPAITQPLTTQEIKATATKTTRKTMSVAQAVEFMRLFRCSKPSAEEPTVKALVNMELPPFRRIFPPQAVIDTELTKWLTVDKKKPSPWGTQVEAVGPENMADDFKFMGFSSDKVQELLVMKEPVKVDGLTQRVRLDTGAGSFVPGTGPEPIKRVRRAAKYQDLILFEAKGESLPLPHHTLSRLHLLTYITRLGPIRSSQAIPCRARRAAHVHPQMGYFRAWQRSRPRDEHNDEVHQIASHASETPQPHRQLHAHRPKDHRLAAHPEPQEEGCRALRRAISSSSSRSWRKAQRNPCRRSSGTTARSQCSGTQKTQHQRAKAQGRRDGGL